MWTFTEDKTERRVTYASEDVKSGLKLQIWDILHNRNADTNKIMFNLEKNLKKYLQYAKWKSEE